MSDLPKDYDIIIVGTGLTESILAGALARIGKSVLHIDRNQFYGGEFASHTLNNLMEWSDKIKRYPDIENDREQNDKSCFKKCNNDLGKYYTEIEYSFSDLETQDKLLKLSRKFTLDLTPNIFYSRGQLIELLISSDVAKYCEFKMVSQILTLDRDGNVQKVPTSRSEVFKSNKLGMLEKRSMMQFVQAVLKDDNFNELIEPEQLQTISFRQLISNKKFPQIINDYLINAVAMCPNEKDNALKGLNDTKKFLTSVGRFGDSPFLYSMYGAGELPQCFCRMSAVFGAIYYLDMTIDKFHINSENRIESITTKNDKEEFKFNCKNLIIDSSYAPIDYFKSIDNLISHCILITDKTIYKNDDGLDHISLLFLPKMKDTDIYMIETSYASNCSPQGYFVVYLFCRNTRKTSRENFEKCIETFFNIGELDENKPNVLFSCFYSHIDSDYFVHELDKISNRPNNLHFVSGCQPKLDFDHHVEQAKKIFNDICPNDEFMPKPPDPEDIIFGDETENKNEISKETNQNETSE
ncbi:unnamed protein product [Brachionus calyciflorus]|uniref:Rab proteins geranylgeranyltransferase component A n=1 Tax=Brachionus calyciflorus TaxID=104777 RepID=A0A814A0P9_9BILA|nr:unnamed protein product [Brachionus calyciflorus]